MLLGDSALIDIRSDKKNCVSDMNVICNSWENKLLLLLLLLLKISHQQRTLAKHD